MKISNFIFYGLFLISNTSYAKDTAQTPDILFTIDNKISNYNDVFCSYLETNGKGDFLLICPSVHYDYYYLHSSYNGEKIHLSQLVSQYLLQIGLDPNYYICSKCIDEFGNILFTFQIGEIRKLGVWHKDHGFKYLPLTGIQNVKRVDLQNGQLIVMGIDETGTIERFVILSLENIWENQRKEPFESDEAATEDNENSWWYWLF
jgi:hypothetical protein